MCGIAGLWRPGGRVDVGALRRMMAAMPHRGPEGAATAVLDDGSLALGFLQLAFTDTVGGLQPLFNEDHTIALVYNGEVYDYEEMRDELIARGHRFRTRSDSEVLIHLYEEHGLDFVQRLNGEFAFALWDGPRRRLVLGRDPFGIKPLYIAALPGGGVAFGSELKAMLARPGQTVAFAPRYFVGPGIGVPDTVVTPFAGVTSVRPGHLLVVTPNGAREEPWWTPPFGVERVGSYDEAVARVRHEVVAAVRRRVRGDVPIALALSSGLDSTIVAGLTARERSGRRAFTLSYPGAPYDEAEAAGRHARGLGLDHEPVPCPTPELAAGFLDSLHQVEIPINSLSTVARLRLTRAVRAAGFKALTGGEAADEVFGGYPDFAMERMWRDQLAGSAHAAAAWRVFQEAEAASRGVFWDGGDAWRRTPPLYGAPMMAHLRALRAGGLARRLLSRDLLARVGGQTPLDTLRSELPPAELRRLSPFDATRLMSRSVVASFAIPALGDRVDMAASLEGRLPFLDAHVVRLGWSLPEDHCIHPETYARKRVLRDAFADLLPPGFGAPPKHTHMAPTFVALAETPIGRDLFAELLAPRAVREAGVFDPRVVRLLRAAWRLAPRRGVRFANVDGVIGYLLSVQGLHRVFTAERAARTPGPDRVAFVDRTPGPQVVGAPA